MYKVDVLKDPIGTGKIEEGKHRWTKPYKGASFCGMKITSIVSLKTKENTNHKGYLVAAIISMLLTSLSSNPSLDGWSFDLNRVLLRDAWLWYHTTWYRWTTPLDWPLIMSSFLVASIIKSETEDLPWHLVFLLFGSIDILKLKLTRNYTLKFLVNCHGC